MRTISIEGSTTLKRGEACQNSAGQHPANAIREKRTPYPFIKGGWCQGADGARADGARHDLGERMSKKTT